MYNNVSSRLRATAIGNISPYLKELVIEAADTLDNLEAVLKAGVFPAADVRPVIRARVETDGNGYKHCSRCGCGLITMFTHDDNALETTPNFCPNCGADMREG